MTCTRLTLRIAALVVALLGAVPLPPSRGCPVCDTPTAEQVRAGLVDDDLVLNVLATLLPIGLVAAVIAAVHFDWPPSPRAWHRRLLRQPPPRNDGERS